MSTQLIMTLKLVLCVKTHFQMQIQMTSFIWSVDDHHGSCGCIISFDGIKYQPSVLLVSCMQGDNQYRNSGQALEFKQLNIHSWEAFDKGQDMHMQAAPSQAELLYKSFQVAKEKLKSQTKDTIMDKYGNAATEDEIPMELLLGQSERQVEYDRAGRIIKGQVWFLMVSFLSQLPVAFLL